MPRRFPPPWTVEALDGCSLSGFKVLDANGQSLAYVYSRETKDANKCERDPASGPFLCNLDLLIMLGGLLLGLPG